MVSGQDVDKNLAQAESLFNSIEGQGIELIVLPEMFACLGVKNQVALAKARFNDSDVLKTIADWSKRLSANIVAGSVPLTAVDNEDRVKASCLVYDAEGQMQTRYDKIHLFDVDVADNKGSYRESDTFSPGETPSTANINGKRLGLSICYDLRFPELFQQYQAQSCDMITVPSAFTYKTGQAHWEILLRARAVETQSFVLAANQGGLHDDGRETWGHSMIIAPTGEILAEVTESGPGVAVAELDFNLLKQVRSAMPIVQHKRL